MQHRDVAVTFNENAQPGSERADRLTFAIRTDANFSTGKLKAHLLEELSARPEHAVPGHLIPAIRSEVHAAYKDWGRAVLEAMGDCLNYESYGFKGEPRLEVHFYDAHQLTHRTMERADALVAAVPEGTDVPAILISLDSMIDAPRTHMTALGFSRLFCPRGIQRYDYVARPGMAPIEEQIDLIRERMEQISADHGGAKVPFVLIEDNVRHASMINTLVSKLEAGGLFNTGRLAGIATSFCCAGEAELGQITFRGEKIPVSAVVDYGGGPVDVVTPRDLLFDGLVVKAGDRVTRMPGVVMDLEQRFKILPEKSGEFRRLVVGANSAFCERLEDKFGVSIPLAWLVDTEALPYAAPQGGWEPEESGIRRTPPGKLRLAV